MILRLRKCTNAHKPGRYKCSTSGKLYWRTRRHSGYSMHSSDCLLKHDDFPEWESVQWAKPCTAGAFNPREFWVGVSTKMKVDKSRLAYRLRTIDNYAWRRFIKLTGFQYLLWLAFWPMSMSQPRRTSESGGNGHPSHRRIRSFASLFVIFEPNL